MCPWSSIVNKVLYDDPSNPWVGLEREIAPILFLLLAFGIEFEGLEPVL